MACDHYMRSGDEYSARRRRIAGRCPGLRSGSGEQKRTSAGPCHIVRLRRLAGDRATVLVKIEGRNPAYSVKDRVGVAMLADAEQRGLLIPSVVRPAFSMDCAKTVVLRGARSSSMSHGEACLVVCEYAGNPRCASFIIFFKFMTGKCGARREKSVSSKQR